MNRLAKRGDLSALPLPYKRKASHSPKGVGRVLLRAGRTQDPGTPEGAPGLSRSLDLDLVSNDALVELESERFVERDEHSLVREEDVNKLGEARVFVLPTRGGPLLIGPPLVHRAEGTVSFRVKVDGRIVIFGAIDHGVTDEDGDDIVGKPEQPSTAVAQLDALAKVGELHGLLHDQILGHFMSSCKAKLFRGLNVLHAQLH